MKTLVKVSLLALVGMVIPFASLKAQEANSIKTGGVYLTEQDYRLNKMSYILDHHDKLEPHEFLKGKDIVLVSKGKKTRLLKKEVFGFNLHQRNFRLYHNEAYRIIDTAGFVLYSLEELTPADKGSKITERHFYSLSLHDPIEELSLRNLENSFPEKTAFRFSLESHFNKDEALMDYDRLSHQYKIKYLYFLF
jgi:hypothetical protein